MIALLATAAWAVDHEHEGASWAEADLPIPVWVGAEAGPLDDAAFEAAALGAMATWEAADCGVSFDYRGRIDDAAFGDDPDGRNGVFFVVDGWPGEPALATDDRVAVEGERIVEGDLALNGIGFQWATSGADGVVILDVRSAITHELGHVLGLAHTDEPGATMNVELVGHPDGNTLEDHDLEAICALYARGDAAAGEACEGDRDCATDLVCLQDAADRYCAPTCATDADCPTDWTCEEADGASVCAMPAAGGCGCSTGNAAGGAWVLLGALAALRRRVSARRA